MTKRGILTNGDYNRNGKFGTIHLRFAKIKLNDKRGMLTAGDFYRNEEFGENSEFGKK